MTPPTAQIAYKALKCVQGLFTLTSEDADGGGGGSKARLLCLKRLEEDAAIVPAPELKDKELDSPPSSESVENRLEVAVGSIDGGRGGRAGGTALGPHFGRREMHSLCITLWHLSHR